MQTHLQGDIDVGTGDSPSATPRSTTRRKHTSRVTATHVLHRILEDLPANCVATENTAHFRRGLGEDPDLFIDQRRQMLAGIDRSELLLAGRQPLQNFLGEGLQRGGTKASFDEKQR